MKLYSPEQSQLDPMFLAEVRYGWTKMTSISINEEDDWPLDAVLRQVSVKVLEDLEEHLPGHVSVLGHRTLPLAGHAVSGDVSELLLTASLSLVDQTDAHVLRVRGDHDGRGVVEPGVSALVVDGPVIATWHQYTLMCHS